MEPAMDRVRRKPDPLQTLHVTVVNLHFKRLHVAQAMAPKRWSLFSSREKELQALQDAYARDHDLFVAALAGVQRTELTSAHHGEVEYELHSIVARFDSIRHGFDLVEPAVRGELQRSFLIGRELDDSNCRVRFGGNFTNLCRQFADPDFRGGAGMSDDEFLLNVYSAGGILETWQKGFTPVGVSSDFVRENLLARAHDLRRAVAAHPQGIQGLAKDFDVKCILGLAIEVHWRPDRPIHSAAVNLESFASSIEDLLELAPDWTYIQQKTVLDVIAEVESAQIVAQRTGFNMVYAPVAGRTERARLRASEAVYRAKRVLYQLRVDVAKELGPRRKAAIPKYHTHMRRW